MDFIFSFFSFLFIALVVGCALAFGFVILMWILAAGVAFTLFFYIREFIRRRLFVYNGTSKPPRSLPEVIDGEYTDITDNK
jgi:hypothetical protein